MKHKQIRNFKEKSVKDLELELEETQAYLARLIQQGRNEHSEFKLNDQYFADEVYSTRKEIKALCSLLDHLTRGSKN